MSGKTLARKSKTSDDKKDFWNTSWEAVRDAQALIGMPFALDAAASDATAAKARTFITPEQDALKTEWLAGHGAVWCNPPFTRKPAFLMRALEQAKRWQRLVLVMIPYEPCTQWWRRHVSGKATAVFMPDGRYSFLDNDTKCKVDGVNFVSCFVLFSPVNVPTQYVEFTRGIGSHLLLPGEKSKSAPKQLANPDNDNEQAAKAV